MTMTMRFDPNVVAAVRDVLATCAQRNPEAHTCPLLNTVQRGTRRWRTGKGTRAHTHIHRRTQRHAGHHARHTPRSRTRRGRPPPRSPPARLPPPTGRLRQGSGQGGTAQYVRGRAKPRLRQHAALGRGVLEGIRPRRMPSSILASPSSPSSWSPAGRGMLLIWASRSICY